MYYTTIIKQTKLLFKLCACIAMVGLSAGTAQAQSYENPEGSISPGAAGFQNVSVDLFRGRANTSIPLYTYKTRSLSIPISLDYTPVDTKSYYTIYNNIPASDGHVYHPGWVGLGWTLSTGGSITRTVKGIPDETISKEVGDLVGNFWNSNIYYDPKSRPAPTTFYDVDEDEFSFNFGGYSGTFFYYRGKWKVLSKETFEISSWVYNGKLYGFLIETPNGITYTFGNYEDSNITSETENAIEYSGTDATEKVPVSWYLVKIESPEGEQINFNYGYNSNDVIYNSYTPVVKQTHFTSYREVPVKNTDTWTKVYPCPELDKYYPTNEQVENGSEEISTKVVYLKSITSNASPIQIVFEKLLFDEMKYPENTSHKSYKLDKISFKFGVENNSFKEIQLNYLGGTYTTGNPTEILKLESIQEYGRNVTTQSLESLPKYGFSYYPNDDEISPNVLSQINYPSGSQINLTFEPHSFFQNSSIAKGLRIRSKIVRSSPDDDAQIYDYYYTQENINEYHDPSIKDMLPTSGQISREELLYKETVSETFIKDNFLTRYRMIKTTQSDCAYPNDEIVKNNTVPPSIVGYSSVWEARSNENNQHVITNLGSTRSQFINFQTYDEATDETTYNNMDLAGTLIYLTTYSSTGEMTHTKHLEYVDLNNQLPRLMRFWRRTSTFLDEVGEKAVQEYGTYITKHTCYKLQKTTEETASSNSEISYNYNPTTKNITQKTETSTGVGTITTTYKYISDFTNWWGSASWNRYLCHRQLNLPVETVVKKDGMIIAAELKLYETIDVVSPSNNNSTKLLKANQVYTLEIPTPIVETSYQSAATDWSTMDSRFKLRVTLNYDAKGNLLQYQKVGAAPITYDYDEYGSLALVKAKGLTHVDYLAYKESLSLNPSNPADVNKMRAYFPSSQITSCTYNPKFGVTSISSSNGVQTNIEFDAFGRLKTVKDINNNVLKTMEYNFGLNQ